MLHQTENSTTVVRIRWSREFENQKSWNDVCAWAIEYFGLPGTRFETRAHVEYMEFLFKNPKDALLMSLRWNAELLEPAYFETF